MNNPLVTLIIPVYNSEATLERCLESIRAQELLPKMEVIIINDGSTDNSVNIIKKYILDHPQIIYIEHAKNMGLLEARRTGLKKSRSKYIMFLDSDDEFAHKNSCQIAYQEIARNNVDLVNFSAKVIQENDLFTSVDRIKIRFETPYSAKLYGTEIFTECFIAKKYNWNTWNKIYTKKILKETYKHIPKNIYNGPTQDLLLYFICATQAKSFFSSPETLINYYVGNGISTKKNIASLNEWHKQVSSLEVYKILKEISQKDKHPEYHQCIAEQLQREKESLLEYKLYNCLKPSLQTAGKEVLEKTLKSLAPEKTKKNSYILTIVFLSHSSGLSGAERDLFDMVMGLSQRNIRCIVILPQKGPLESLLITHNITTYISQYGYSGWWSDKDHFNLEDFDKKMTNSVNATNKELLPYIKSINPDFIYTQTIGIPWGCLCARKLSIPHILCVEEYGELDHSLHFEFGFQECMDVLYKNSSIICCLTKDLQETVFFSKRTEQDFNKKFTIIGNAINIPKEYRLKELFIPRPKKKTVRILVAGWIHQSKGQLDVIKALHELKKKNYAVTLCLVGSFSSYLETIQHEIYKRDLTKIVEIKSFIKDNFLEISKADIVVSCSRKEALGRTLFEGALMKKPIIYTRAGGPKEVFIENIHGLAYNPGDHLELAEKLQQIIDQPKATAQRIMAAKNT